MVLPRVAVAASGGRDSTALLHCTQRQAQAVGVSVVALHVHHGLQLQADDWLVQVRQQSKRWGADFCSRRLDGAPAPGDSVEAWARKARYRALAEMAAEQGCSLVLLAHHRRDQAETWLLQALRGAGAAGLSAMPALAHRQGLTWARPWLDQPAQAIEAYARRHRLRFVQDPSNADPRYARSRLRQAVWPVLTAAFPDVEQVLVAAAARAQDAQALAQEAAQADLSALVDAQGLDVATWWALPPARRKNALAAWLKSMSGAPVPSTLLARLMNELQSVSSGRWPAPAGELRLYRGRLSVSQATPAPVAVAVPRATVLDLSRAGTVPLTAWAGHWRVQPSRFGGVPVQVLQHLIARPREGGEQFRLRDRAAARSLKKQYQALAVPPWARTGPLLFTPQGDLVFVPGLGIEAAFQAKHGQPQCRLQWMPDASS